MATNNKPANTLRCGNIKATIWQNVSEKGPFFSTTCSRRFKDQSGRGAMGPRSSSMTLRPLSLSRVMPRSGLPSKRQGGYTRLPKKKPTRQFETDPLLQLRPLDPLFLHA